MKNKLFVLAIVAATVGNAHAESPVEQYASTVLGFSSQWSSGGWNAAQATGAPNTFSYGDIPTAWATSSLNGTLEYISLGFSTPVYSSGAVIRETYGNGFVYQVDAIDSNNNYLTVWSGSDTSQPGTPVDFALSWATTSFLTTGLKIYVNTSHNLNAWEEIDSVKLQGQLTAPVPEPETYAMLMAGLGLMGAVARRRKSKQA